MNEKKIQHLETNLAELRQLLFASLPAQMRELLASVYSCETGVDVEQWKHWVGCEIANLEGKLEGSVREHPELDRFRSPCPLCKSRPQNMLIRHLGYAMPSGLFDHLRGMSRQQACRVLHHIAEMRIAQIEGLAWGDRH